MNILCDFEYYAPKTLAEALELTKKFGSKCKILAGGTDLMIMLKEKMITTENVIDIGDIPELREIKVDANGATIGACAKISDVNESPELQKAYGALAYACGELGSNQVRRMATLGGNACHSSPAAETPPVLCAYDAQAVVKKGDGSEQSYSIEDFIEGNRKNKLNAETGDILVKFVLPKMEPKSACKFDGIGLRSAMEIDCVNMGVKIALDSDNETIKSMKLVMGSVFPRPLVSAAVPALLVGKKLTDDLVKEAAVKAQEEAKPITDVRASADYRKDVVGALARRLIKEAYAAAKEA